MSALKNIKTEIIIFIIIAIFVYYSYKPDIFFSNLFVSYSDSYNLNYLNTFFIQITELGNSFWYFFIISISIIFLFLNKYLGVFNTHNYDRKLQFFISSFIYILISGIFTQLIKHLVGRPRPNYANVDIGFDFDFFTTNSNFHSFPSGHSSTIFMVCFILSSVLPKLKYYFYFLTFIVALSRVVVGAHFFTDIIAGGLLSFIIFKFLNTFYKSKYKRDRFSKIDFKNSSHINYLFIILSGIGLFVTVGSSLDIYISSFFYLGNLQFYLQSFDYLSILFRKIFLPGILIYILLLPITAVYIKNNPLFFGHKFSIKEIILIWVSQIITILIIINSILKNLWGRVRPGEILEFGGLSNFTPWYEFSDVCTKNCSFVSGDASVGFSICILYFITKKIFYIYAGLFSGLSLGIIRIMAGGHFTSDIIFAGIIVIVLNYIIYIIYKKYE